MIELMWPDKRLNPNARGRWSEDEDAFLKFWHGQKTLEEIGEVMGRTRFAVRARITRLGISKRHLWSPDEEASLVELYRSGKPLRLDEFAERMGRDKSNVCRKAASLGLEINRNRPVVEHRKVRVPKYKDPVERRAATSLLQKEWYRNNPHPRGMLGKKHSDESKRKMGEVSSERWQSMAKEDQEKQIMKALKTKVERYGSIAPNVKRGSWRAGWREIGGYKKYYRSRWEANYARYLQWLKDNGEIHDWKHEPETFWFEAIKRGVRSYLPDFRVWEIDGSSRLHEVKGWMDARSKTTLKRMAKYHPSETIVLIDERQYKSIEAKVSGLISGWEPK